MTSIGVLNRVSVMSFATLAQPVSVWSANVVKDMTAFGNVSMNSCTIYVEGSVIKTTRAPVLEESRVFVLVDDIFLKYGYKRLYDEKTGISTYSSKGYEVKIDHITSMATINDCVLPLNGRVIDHQFFVEASCLQKVLPVSSRFEPESKTLYIKSRLDVIVAVEGRALCALLGTYHLKDKSVFVCPSSIGLALPEIKVRESSSGYGFSNNISGAYAHFGFDGKVTGNDPITGNFTNVIPKTSLFIVDNEQVMMEVSKVAQFLGYNLTYSTNNNRLFLNIGLPVGAEKKEAPLILDQVVDTVIDGSIETRIMNELNRYRRSVGVPELSRSLMFVETNLLHLPGVSKRSTPAKIVNFWYKSIKARDIFLSPSFVEMSVLVNETDEGEWDITCGFAEGIV